MVHKKKTTIKKTTKVKRVSSKVWVKPHTWRGKKREGYYRKKRTTTVKVGKVRKKKSVKAKITKAKKTVKVKRVKAKVKKPLLLMRKIKLDNKSRKGDYYYVKGRGKVGKYYKIKKGLGEEDYKEYYKRGIISKRGGVRKGRIRAEKRLDRLSKKYPKIEEVIGSGYAEYTIRNAKKFLTPQGIRLGYIRLLMNRDKAGDGHGVVRDKELLQLITRPENVEKWKHRIGYKADIYNERGDVMATIVNTNVKGLNNFKSDIIDEIKIGSEHGDFSKAMVKIGGKGYRVEYGTHSGRVGNINIKLIFRKSR